MGTGAPRFVVAIGASAGGLSSIEAFLDQIPGDSGLAFVLIQHLSPDYKSFMGQILGKHTTLPIEEATDDTALCADHIYLMPPGYSLLVIDGVLQLLRREDTESVHLPIDRFFESVADDFGARAIAVVLSGSGSDGSAGIRAVKDAGGLILVQDHTAQFDGMPRHAIATGLADFVLPPEEIAKQILVYTGLSSASLRRSEIAEDDLDGIIERLRNRTGIDFGEYKADTIAARVEKRMRLAGIHRIEDYTAAVDSSGEVDLLARELMIGVTAFFRDPRAFAALETALDGILESGTREIRIWVVGCSTGEEAYSIAMLLEERMTDYPDVGYKIFATDIDGRAVSHAGRGVFKSISGVPESLAAKYLRPENSHHCISRRIRERIVFALHNVASDPPFTRMDLVACRNVLIYQNPKLQSEVLGSLHFALRAEGLLFLGPDETLGSLGRHFTSVSERWRIFRRLPGQFLPRLASRGALPARTSDRAGARKAARFESALLCGVASALLRVNAESAVLFNDRQVVELIFGDASPFLQVPEGQQTRDVLKMLRGDLRLAATALIRRLKGGEHDAVGYNSVNLSSGGEQRAVDMTVSEVVVGDREFGLMSFGRVRELTGPQAREFEADGEGRKRMLDLETELGEVRQRLEATIDDLESANEAFQSTNEELIAANEELQTTNEELHSVNEELHTVNAEHQRKIVEQEILARDLDHLLETAEIASIFLDSDLRIRKYTPAITKVIPLIPEDIGRPVTHLKHDLENTDLQELVERVEREQKTLVLHVRGPGDQWFRLRALPYRGPGRQSGVVVDLVDITAIEMARSSLAESEERFRQLAENIHEVFWMRDVESMAIVYLSPAFVHTFGRPPERYESGDGDWAELVHEEDRQAFRRELASTLEKEGIDITYRTVLPDGKVRWIHDRGFPIKDEAGTVIRVAGLAEDITKQKADEETQREAARALEDLARRDPLTQLANRRGLERELDRAQERTRRDGARVAAILVDCDDFKRVNDTFGHAVGDVALQRIARILEAGVRPSDRLGRIGGDEFLVILPDTRLAEAREVAERLRLSLADTRLRVGRTTHQLTASFGVGLVSFDAVSIEEVIAETQAALKRGKDGGKNIVATHDHDFSREAAKNDVDAVLSRNELSVVKHGIHDLVDGSLVGYEFLSRGPRGALEDPASFFRVAIETNRLTAVDLRCLRNCLAAARGSGDLSKHVNVYPSTLLDTSREGLEQLFANTDASYCVELSEQQFIGDPSYVRDRIDLLKELGVRIAIDDVGFGRSSLEALIVLEPDVIKIDQSFVQGCATDRRKERSLRRLVQVARGLHCEIVAEGVETEDDVAILKSVAVRFAQGFLWGEPRSAVTATSRS